jgi:acetoacetyl-CoA synthetase
MLTHPRSSPFVQLKAGSENPPILIVHGLDGLASFAELAKHIRTGNPIFGIRAKGVDGLEEPLDRIEDMAEFYVESFKGLQFQSPCILVGYSFGGLVALEMAQRLSQNPGSVALLALLDTFPHPRFLPAPQRVSLFMKRMKSHANQMRQLSLPNAFSYFAKGLKRRLHYPGALHDSQIPPETLGLSPAVTVMRRVNQKAYLAYQSYRPRFYRGKMKLVTTQTNNFCPKDPRRVWGGLVSELEVDVIPGDHLNIVTTQFQGLAAVLTRYVKHVTPEVPRL